jgi:hypothetical protein
VELATLAQQRLEERQPLDVVPVEVADEAARLQRLVVGARTPEVTQAGAEIEQDGWLTRDLDGDARRVTAVARDLGSVARRRAADPIERDDQVFPTDGEDCTGA